MATSRGPLLARPPPHQSPSHHSRIHKSTSSLTKRPRSPESAASGRSKRAKAPSHTPTPVRSSVARDERRADHEGRRVEKEAVKGAREEEFRIKYRSAFPSWVFYFDADVPMGPALENARADIEALGARVDSFFSAEVTHLITNQAVPPTPIQSTSTSTMDNKENASKLRNAITRTASHLKSPFNGKSRHADDDHSVLAKAQQFGIKIWHLAKLGSVIERCVLPEERYELPGPSRGTSQKGSLTSLLAAERLHSGKDRDSAQRRQDYHYFNKNSYFVLVEDIRGELATIAAAEFAITKEADGEERGAWPVLHCHPRSRGPFIPFDEKEERRWEKQENALKQRQVEKDKAKARFLRKKRRQEEWQALQAVETRKQGGGDLRRTVSLNNLRRGDSLQDTTVGDLDTTGLFDSAYASGFLASGTNIAASGNSVAITSTTGTTSAVGTLNGRPLPPNLRGKVLNEVPLRRRSQLADADAPETAQSGVMGPPAAIPPRLDGRKGLLRKAKSTNTIRLPKRNEGAKPGFCESCRTKFEDFTKHIGGKRHRNFATNPNNFTQLDIALSRVRRRTTTEVATENARYASGEALFSELDHDVPLHFASTDSDALDHATLL